MGIFSGLSGMIETVMVKAAPQDMLPSLRKLIPLENVLWRSPDLSFAAMDSLPRHRQNGANIGNLPDIIDLSEVVMDPNIVPSNVHWQNINRSNQAGKTAKSRRSPQQSPQPMPSGETVQSSQNQPSSQSHMTLNRAFASGFMPELITGSTRIWLIWLKMRCKPPHKVVQNLSVNRSKRVISL